MELEALIDGNIQMDHQPSDENGEYCSTASLVTLGIGVWTVKQQIVQMVNGTKQDSRREKEETRLRER